MRTGSEKEEVVFEALDLHLVGNFVALYACGVFSGLFRFKTALQYGVEFRLVERLRHIIECAELNSLNHCAGVTHAGENNDLLLRTNLLALFNCLQAIHARHSHVEQNKIRLQPFLNPLNCLKAAARRFYGVVIYFEQCLRITKHAGLVINDQDGRVWAH